MSQNNTPLTQNEIDEREWNNPQNWRWAFYCSRVDSRIFVPKRWGYGLTANFGRQGTYWFFLLLLHFPVMIIATILLSRALS
jgi:uncharacterized membrane protein